MNSQHFNDIKHLRFLQYLMRDPIVYKKKLNVDSKFFMNCLQQGEVRKCRAQNL